MERRYRGRRRLLPLTYLDAGDFEKTCFYITPIGEENSAERRHAYFMMSYIIEPAVKEFDLKVVRADEVALSDDTVKLMKECREQAKDDGLTFPAAQSAGNLWRSNDAAKAGGSRAGVGHGRGLIGSESRPSTHECASHDHLLRAVAELIGKLAFPTA